MLLFPETTKPAESVCTANTMLRFLKKLRLAVEATTIALMLHVQAGAVTTVYFDGSQIATLVATNANSDTIESQGYLFTYTRDKLFTGGTTKVIGRPVRVFWPEGLEAQYVTTITNKAQITIRRVDGAVFDLTAFSAKLLANPGAGRAIEVVPFLNGQEPLNDPIPFDVSSGYDGSVHSFNDTTPAYIGSTAALTNYDAYVLNLTLDFALVSLTVVDASLPPPVLDCAPLNATTIQLSWPTNHTGYVLQQKSSLSDASWVNAAESIAIAGENYQVTVLTTNSARFFRLRHP